MSPSQPIATPQSIIPDSGSPPTQSAWQSAFSKALPYEAFLKNHATLEQQEKWEASRSHISLSDEHKRVLEDFVRKMPVMVLAGAWCGDCVSQCPIFWHFAEITSCIDLRFLDRDSQPEIAAHLQENVGPDFILSPDKGAIDRASAVAEAIDLPFSYLEKTRIDAHTIVHKAKDLQVEGKIVAIVDDMIATGGTICKAADALRSQGATEVHAACTHGLFTGGAIARLSNHVDGVHATSSLSNSRAVISGGAALARGVRKILEDLQK